MTATRRTRQGDLVLEAVMHRDDHPTAPMLLAELRGRDPGFSSATLYRHLDRLVRAGRLRTVEHDGERRYDPNTSLHAHAQCITCGRLSDIPMPAVTTRAHGLSEVDTIEVTVRGRCNACA